MNIKTIGNGGTVDVEVNGRTIKLSLGFSELEIEVPEIVQYSTEVIDVYVNEPARLTLEKSVFHAATIMIPPSRTKTVESEVEVQRPVVVEKKADETAKADDKKSNKKDKDNKSADSTEEAVAEEQTTEIVYETVKEKVYRQEYVPVGMDRVEVTLWAI